VKEELAPSKVGENTESGKGRLDTYALEPAHTEADIEELVLKTLGTATDVEPQQTGDRPPNTTSYSPPPLPISRLIEAELGRAPQSDPWCYVFLDRYAKITTGIVLGSAAVIVAIGTLMYFWRLYEMISLTRRFGASFWSLLWSCGVVTLYFAAGLAVFLLLLVVPIVFGLALIHVIVDVGRNLRAIRASLAGEE
jgi:hypothetical protein